jgi:bacterioferritin-associated ferredoxin
MTPEQYADKQIKRYVTSCCKVAPTQIGRATSVCSNCGKDVSLEMSLIYQSNFDHHKTDTDGRS